MVVWPLRCGEEGWAGPGEGGERVVCRCGARGGGPGGVILHFLRFRRESVRPHPLALPPVGWGDGPRGAASVPTTATATATAAATGAGEATAPWVMET